MYWHEIWPFVSGHIERRGGYEPCDSLAAGLELILSSEAKIYILPIYIRVKGRTQGAERNREAKSGSLARTTHFPTNSNSESKFYRADENEY